MSLSPSGAQLLLKLPCGVPTRAGAKAKEELLEKGLATIGRLGELPALMLTDHGAAVRATLERKR